MAFGEAWSRPSFFQLSALALKTGAAAIALLIVVSVTTAGVYGETRPVTALAWSPANAEAASIWASRALRADKAGADAHARVMAQVALARDATSVDAWRTLAETADRKGDVGLARRRYSWVERLSRRDQQTHFWLANDFLQRGMIGATVEQLDLALRTSESNWDRFLPMMVAASADARVVEPLRRRLQSAPNWRDPFMARLAASAPNLSTAAQIAGSLDWHVPAQREWIAILLQRMADRGDYDLAWRFYTQVRGWPTSQRPARIVDGDFESSGQYPFGWGLVDEDDLSAQRGARPGDKGNSLLIGVSDGHSGSVARQLLALPAGAYRISARMGGVPKEADERPNITVSCAGQSSPLVSLRGSEAATTDEGGVFAADLSVPEGCAWQWLAVEVAGGDEPTEVSSWVDDLAIRVLHGPGQG